MDIAVTHGMIIDENGAIALEGATVVLIVAEPTVSGRHDRERVAELSAFFKIPSMVCINKFDLNPDEGKSIEAFTKQRNIKVMGKVPFDPAFTQALVQGRIANEAKSQSS